MPSPHRRTRNRNGMKITKHAKREMEMLFRLDHALPREQLIPALQAQGDERFDTLARQLVSPTFKNRSLATLARQCGLKYAEVLDAFRKHSIDIGMVRAMQHYPEVMEDIAIDAKSHTVPCGACDGTGKVTTGEATRKCVECHGTGELRLIGNVGARKLLLEAAGVIGQHGPLIDARRVTVSLDDGLEETFSIGRKALDAPTIKAEVVEEGSDGR